MRVASLAQPIIAGVVAGITGFAGAVALLIAALGNVGATQAETASAILALSVVPGVLGVLLSLRTRLPILIVWSTPGAALLLATHNAGDYGDAISAFLLCGVLILLTGAWPWLARLVTRIPKPIASAMLAGVLFSICLAPLRAVVELPLLALPIVVTWLVLSKFAPRWAVPAALVVALVVVGLSSDGFDLGHPETLLPALTLTIPGFDVPTILGIGIPLYLVTMAGQNVTGFTVLRTFGYEHPPARAVLLSTGAGTLVAAPFGGFAMNIAAITAAMVAGPDAHPDRDKRWVAGVAAAVTTAALGLVASLVTALFLASPSVLVTAVAGLALFGALATAIVGALEDPAHRVVAVVTFVVAASGQPILGLGSAFWALLVGSIVMLWLAPWRRRRAARDATPEG
jgi:benzoate transporter